MQCPNCDVTLVMSHRQGIEIDYCPQCRGIWLDRGELDKIIERESREASPQQGTGYGAAPAPQQGSGGGYAQQPGGNYRQGGDYYHKKKKKSLLGELFDF